MGSPIETLFRREARIVQAPIHVDTSIEGALTVEELAYVRNAVPKRRAEFATARVCAREALAALGIPSIPRVPLVPKADRAPTWPAGIVGSISHTAGYCAVVVDRAPPMRAVGLDVEMVRPLEEGTIAMILTPRERAWLTAQPAASRDDLAILCFSAKEAFYKCQYVVTEAFLDFSEVELEVSVGQGHFVARVLKAGWPASVARLEGKFLFEDGRVLCGVELYA